MRIPTKSAGDSGVMSATHSIEVGRPFQSMSAGVALPVGWIDLSIVTAVGSSHGVLLSLFLRSQLPRSVMRWAL